MKRLMLFLGIMLMFPFQASANYVVDTGSGWPQFGVSIYNRSNGDFQFNAGQFTISQAYTVSSLEGWTYSGNEGTVELVLYGDSGNLPDPTNEILRQSFNVDYSASGPITDWQGLTGLDLPLDPGSYWISFEKSSIVDGFSVNLPSGAPAPLLRYAYMDEDTGGSWVPYAGGQGFRVGVSNVIPEPAALSLFGFGLLGLAFKRKRNG